MTAARRRIVIVRHGETVHNAAGIWQGQLDSPLSDLGERQAAALGPALADLNPQRIVSSDLTRAARTAQAVAEVCGIPLSFDERYREIHAGAWQGLTNAEVVAQWPQERAAVMRGEDLPRGGDGESMGDVMVRVGAALDELVDTMEPGECVIVSTHGAAGRCAAAHLLGFAQEQAWRVFGAFDNCHWAELAEGNHGWRLLTWNVGSGAPVREGSGPP